MEYRYWGFYKVYENGDCISPKGKVISFCNNQKGYKMSRLKHPDGNWKTIVQHKVVMLAWKGERPDGYEIDHIDNDRSNNHKDNLRYVTKHDNRVKSYREGYRNVTGTKNANCKHTEEEVRLVCDMLMSNGYGRASDGYGRFAEISRLSGVNRNTVVNIAKRRQWKHISKDYNF